MGHTWRRGGDIGGCHDPPPPDGNAFKVGIPWNKNKKHVDYNDIFFKHFFVDLIGKAKLMDGFLSDKRCDFYHTVKNDNIKFHRPDRDDLDCIVSCIPSLLLFLSAGILILTSIVALSR